MKPSAGDAGMIAEILSLTDEVAESMKKSCYGALRIGLRLLALHRLTANSDSPGGFSAALDAMEGRKVNRSTAYRWLNAASAVLCAEHGASSAEEVYIPASSDDKEWGKLEAILKARCEGMSLRRLVLGAAATGEESRLDSLISAVETGDDNASDILDKVASGNLTLVQAIRALAGSTATKGKDRHDPVYLDIDGRTGQPTGLFPKCMVTLANTFARWEGLDEVARAAAKQSWKALVANLPRELR